MSFATESRQCSTLLIGLYVPLVVLVSLFPRFILGNAEEIPGNATLRCLHDGRDELLHKTGCAQERRPEAVDEVDEQPFDVRTVVVLVSHDHHLAVPQAVRVFVTLPRLQAQDFLERRDLRVVHHLQPQTVSDTAARRGGARIPA